MANSHKKFSASSRELEQQHPLTSRKTVDTLKNQEGEIVVIDAANFGIQYKNDSNRLLLPLNLPAPLQKAGVKVIFSGSVKQISPEEFWAAQPVILTAIKEK